MDIYFYLKFWLSFKRKVLMTRKLESIYDLERLTGTTEKRSEEFKDIQLFVFDVDDTIAEYRNEISDQSLELFESLKEKGFKVAVLSNCGRRRRAVLTAIFTPLGIDVEPTNFKPNPYGYLQICKRAGVKPANSVMVGDKLGMDLYGAYLAKFKERILVKPFTDLFGGKRSSLLEQFSRLLENMTLR